MSEQQVPRVATPVAPADLYASLRGAWQAICGEEPQRCSVLLLVAHWAHETGGGHACWNYNLGNAKHVSGDGRDYFVLHCNEFRPDGTEYWVDATFRAFAGLTEGVADYMGLMRGAFGYAWPFVESGDAAGFVHALRARGYFTAPEAEYAAGVQRWVRQLDQIIPADPAPPLAVMPVLPDPNPDA